MRAGRLLRQLQQDAARGNDPAAVRERFRLRACSEQAVREREARFPLLDAANAGEAMAWQAARLAELTAAAARPATREEFCTHPDQRWCDCDWCRVNGHWVRSC